ncbi:MAG: hypothetical protein MUF15_10720 [Acidobacteria bacterium]|jgi:hypothetical protein|nr:hypothetical protein [Acidobacteriota bacterium]
MFEKWEIPGDICSVFPISYNNLELFVGHSEQTKFLSDLLANQCVIVLEGEIGVGKTSMGNYVRHSKKGYFSPSVEIPCKPKWDNDTFMVIVLAAIVNDIMRKGSPHSSLRKEKLIQKLHETFSDVKLANFGLNGAGFGFQKGETMTRSLFINQTVLIDYLLQIGQILSETYHKDAPIIIQINNLDSEYGFEQEDLVKFLNEIRDTLQIPHISWLIGGAEGLENFIRKNVPRVRQIIGSFMTVNPLSFEEVMAAFSLRIKKSGMKGRLPVDTNLMKYIYDIANGSFREILNIVYQLLVKYNNEPLVKIINMEHARYFFHHLGKTAC